jgi:hypothetical protein
MFNKRTHSQRLTAWILGQEATSSAVIVNIQTTWHNTMKNPFPSKLELNTTSSKSETEHLCFDNSKYYWLQKGYILHTYMKETL